MRIKRITLITLGLLFIVILGACGSSIGEVNPTTSGNEASPFTAPGPGEYDSADTSVVTKISTVNKTITFYNYELDKSYTLNYDGTTSLKDKYETAMSIAQVRLGTIVNINFLKSKKLLVSLQESPETFSYSEVSGFAVNEFTKVFSVGSDNFKITNRTVLLSENQNIEYMDLNAKDVVTITGIDTTIYSIVVDKGHGYLRLSGDDYFIGGFLEIGNNMIYKIGEDMLTTVPEGTYQVRVSNSGNEGVKTATIKRNEETTVDLSDIEIEETKTGKVLFSVSPSTAIVYVDGKQVDYSVPLSYEYGLHQMIVTATGYDTITQYFRIGEVSANLNVILEKTSTKDTSTKTDTSSNNVSTASKTYLVYIDSPVGVEVYLDGNYVGISPVSFAKVAGSHVITLRKTGYTTRSFTVMVDDEAKDISYTFEALALKVDDVSGSVSQSD